MAKNKEITKEDILDVIIELRDLIEDSNQTNRDAISAIKELNRTLNPKKTLIQKIKTLLFLNK